MHWLIVHKSTNSYKTCELYHSCTFIPFHFGSLLPSPLPVGQRAFLPCPDGLLPHCLFRTDQWKDCTVEAAGRSPFLFCPILQCRLVAGLYVFPVSLDNGECIVQILLYNIVTSGSIGSQEVVELVAAVGSDACFQRMVQQGGE